MSDLQKLDSMQMVEFAARGFVRLDAVVPEPLNRAFLRAMGVDVDLDPTTVDRFTEITVPAVPAGAEIMSALPARTPLGEIVRLPRVRGAVESLVGPHSLLDHHFVHVLPSKEHFERRGITPTTQHLHQDSTIDPRESFDVQLFYFPQDVTAEMGGTRFVPGSHLRIVSEAAVSRYQNMRGQQHIVCTAGTIFFMHHGIWHGGGLNHTNRTRYLYKLRLNPVVPQVRLWDTSDMTSADFEQQPIFFVKERHDPNSVASILTRPEPWFEQDTGRIEFIQRIKFWRRLLGDDSFDAHYWVSRLECTPLEDQRL